MSITLDGLLNDWLQADRLDQPGQGVTGYEIYGHYDGTHLSFAIKKPAGSQIGANTTIWIDWDFNHSTGYHVSGTGLSGHEYKIEFNAQGQPSLFAVNATNGSAVGSPLGPVSVAYNTDHTVVELKFPVGVAGAPATPPSNKVAIQLDVNETAAQLPVDYSSMEFVVHNSADMPVRTSTEHRIAIVYSETTAANFWGLSLDANKTGYSQLFMAAQSQAMQAGVPFDVISESDLKDLSKLVNYDALVFPSFRNVNSADLSVIEQNLLLASRFYNIDIIAAGEFMTNSETGAALPNAYGRMTAILDIQRVNGGAADIQLVANTSNPVLEGYTNGETIHSYDGIGYNYFSSASGVPATVLANQIVNGNQTVGAVLMTQTGGTNIHFATESYLGDNNLLGQAIRYAVHGSELSVGLKITRDEMVLASRVDMDEAQEIEEVIPPGGGEGINTKLLHILEQWKAQYNFVGSYYITIGDNPAEGRETNWAVSGPIYQQMLAMGNEIGSHSVSHLADPSVYPNGEDTNFLTPAQIQYEFQQSKAIIEAMLGITVAGAAIPGMPEQLRVAQAISQYYDYISGGWTGIGAGFPNAFGYLTPDNKDSVYIAPNVTFDFTQIGFLNKTPAQADAAWAAEFAALTEHASTPIIVWPWHDYGATNFFQDPNNEYNLEMFTNMIARAAAAGAEFVTLADLAKRIESFHAASVSTTVAGNTITANVSPGAGQSLGTSGLEVNFTAANQVINSVTGWYAYSTEKVFVPVTGGSFQINVGTDQQDVTRITKLPMRADLVSVTGNGSNLAFALSGQGTATVTVKTPGAADVITAEGADAATLAGTALALGFNAISSHNATVNVGAAVATAGNQFFFGGSGDNSITGAGGNDRIDGGGGNDTAVFSGTRASYNITLNPDGTYTLVDSRALTPDGTDIARNIELFKFSDGTFSQAYILIPYTVVTGTSANNTLRDDASAPMIATGLGGNDTYIVTKGESVVTENANQGTDLVQTTLASYTLSANVENLTFTGSGAFTGVGNTLANVITGGFGADTLNGAGGADRLLGGNGNDTYIIGNAGVTIIEAAGAGIDTVRTSLNSYTLGANVENLRATGAAPFTGVGNTLANVIAGSTGGDALTGGGGDDKFEFRKGATGFGLDSITDFLDGAGAAGDSIQFASDVFTTFSQVQTAAAQSGSNVVITVDALNKITIQNFSLANLSADDFLFIV